MQILFGSDDAGAINYFNILFRDSCFGYKRFYSRHELVSDLHLIIKENNEHDVTIMTGSALGNKTIDKEAIEICNDIGIPCYSVVDHWSWYRKRFQSYDKLIFPSRILVNDEIAYEDAILDGLPSDRLISLGNPVLEEMSIRSTNCIPSVINIRNKYNIPIGKKVTLFISEQLRDDFPPDSESYLGYDEYDVIEILISNLGLNDHLVIKLHPVEFDNKYAFINDCRVSIIRDAEVQDLAAVGDVIVGMASMLLLELAMFRSDIISFRPGATKMFIGERLGVTIGVKSIEDLKEVIKHKKTVESNFRQRFVGSKERIIKFIENMAI